MIVDRLCLARKVEVGMVCHIDMSRGIGRSPVSYGYLVIVGHGILYYGFDSTGKSALQMRRCVHKAYTIGYIAPLPHTTMPAISATVIGIDTIIGFEGIGYAVYFNSGVAQTIGISTHRTAYVTRVGKITL